MHVQTSMAVGPPVKCQNPECDKPVRDRTRSAGMYPKYCSVYCRSHAKYLRTRRSPQAQKMAKWRSANPWSRLMRYGLSAEQSKEAWALREHGCNICGGTERLTFDHCHATKRPRSWLCNGCNVGIGHLGDDPARLRAAADYLERHQ